MAQEQILIRGDARAGSSDPRVALDQLILRHRTGYAALSKLLGRNDAYIHQFIKRGSPRALSEQDRRILAQYFDVDERVLGAIAPNNRSNQKMVGIPYLTCEGQIPFANQDARSGEAIMGFGAKWLEELTSAKESDFALFRVVEGSMEPTLFEGDNVLLDLSEGAAMFRDGLYVLRSGAALTIKRIALEVSGLVSIISDNKIYPSWSSVAINDINIVGRAIWLGQPVR